MLHGFCAELTVPPTRRKSLGHIALLQGSRTSSCSCCSCQLSGCCCMRGVVGFSQGIQCASICICVFKTNSSLVRGNYRILMDFHGFVSAIYGFFGQDALTSRDDIKSLQHKCRILIMHGSTTLVALELTRLWEIQLSKSSPQQLENSEVLDFSTWHRSPIFVRETRWKEYNTAQAACTDLFRMMVSNS